MSRNVGLLNKAGMSTSRRRNVGHSMGGGTSEAKKPHTKTVNIKFWVDPKKKKVIKKDLVGLGYVAVWHNPFVVSLIPSIVVCIWVAIILYLVSEDEFNLEPVDGTVIGIATVYMSFLASQLISGALTRRGKNIRNFKSLISAVVNTASGLDCNMKVEALAKAMIKIKRPYPHGGVTEWVDEMVSGPAILQEINELGSALLVSQRNVLREGLDLRLLPLQPHLTYEIRELLRSSSTSDPLVRMQTMIWRRIILLGEAGVLYRTEDTMVKTFSDELVTWLGNSAIDSASGTPDVFTVFYWFSLILILAYTPFWLIPLYPDGYVFLASTAIVMFFTSVPLITGKMADIYVKTAKNTYSGYNLAQEVRTGAENVDEIYKGIIARIPKVNK